MTVILPLTVMDVPVLFIVYRRPDPTAHVFQAIAAARPRRLFIAADGPRHPGEAEACDAARRAATAVTWPCEVLTDFSTVNLGCKVRVSSAVDWFFTACESGIVLEDDTQPAPDFFRFCQVMLERYRDDARVMNISGETYRHGRSEYSYYFSKYALIWGWATWRRAWRSYDLEMRSWPRFRREAAGLALYDSDDERTYWEGVFQQMYEGTLTTWDYAWIYACLTQRGLSVHPSVNLVRNIGTADGATHMTANPFLTRTVAELEAELRHPAWVVRDRQADLDTFDDRFAGGILKHQRTWRHQAGRPGRWARRTLSRLVRP